MPGLVARLAVEHLALEAAALRPAQVHAQQHLGPVLRLGAAGARMDRDDGVLAIVLAAEHLLGLAGVDLARRARRGRARGRRRRLRPPAPTRAARRDRRSVAAEAVAQRRSSSSQPARRCRIFCAVGLVLPEVRRGDLSLRARLVRAGVWAASKIAPQVGGALQPGRAERRTRSSIRKLLMRAFDECGCRAPARRWRRPTMTASESQATRSPMRRRSCGLHRSGRRRPRARSRTGRCAISTRPYGSTKPLMPVLAARTR